jgi:glyoxylase-like metal-dependent hydrolase (beta-lactamase superfamily II)
MILEQHYLACLSQASYLVGDEAAGVAAVVDPRRDVDLYLEAAAKHGLAIRHVVLTHFHADFVAGHLELARRTGATIHLGTRARADYPFEPLSEGDEIALGAVRLRALETPGHTPEGISLLVYDGPEAAQPHAVMTGDTLFIGDVGRPDLMASVGVTAAELAGMLYDSTRGKLLALPDATLLYPGHGAGSMCGKSLSTDTVSTIGDQRRFNYALQEMSREDFIALVTADQPQAPAYFGYDARMNRERRGMLEDALAGLRALDLAAADAALAAGAVALDVRTPEDYAAAHLAGSISVGLDGRFATWAGTVLPPDAEVVLIAPEGREREAALRLGRIGYDRVRGYLAGGVGTVPAARRRAVCRYDAPELARELAGGASGGAPPRVLDVRQPGEVAAGAIADALAIPLTQLADRLDEVPAGPFVIQCAGGYRSMIAASLFERAGREDLHDLRGGMTAWQAAGLPTVTAEGARRD